MVRLGIESLDEKTLTGFLDGLEKRFGENGYRTERDAVIGRYKTNMVGKKTGFVLMLGNVLARHVVVTGMDGVDMSAAKDYRDTMMNHAWGDRPLGGILVMSVIVSNEFSDELKNWAQKESLSRGIGAVGCLVLLSLASHEAYSPGQPSIFGRWFFGEVRKVLSILTDF